MSLQEDIDRFRDSEISALKARCEEAESLAKFHKQKASEYWDERNKYQADLAAARHAASQWLETANERLKELEAAKREVAINDFTAHHVLRSVRKELSETQAKLDSAIKALDAWMETTRKMEKVIERIKALENPYPEDIFIEPTHEQFQAFNKYLEQFGISPDAYNGSMGRRTWNNLMTQIKEAFLGEIGGR